MRNREDILPRTQEEGLLRSCKDMYSLRREGKIKGVESQEAQVGRRWAFSSDCIYLLNKPGHSIGFMIIQLRKNLWWRLLAIHQILFLFPLLPGDRTRLDFFLKKDHGHKLNPV